MDFRRFPQACPDVFILQIQVVDVFSFVHDIQIAGVLMECCFNLETSRFIDQSCQLVTWLLLF